MADENFPGPRVRGRSQEERDKMGKLFDNLCAALYPYMEKAVPPIVLAELSLPPSEEDLKREKNLLEALNNLPPEALQKLEEAGRSMMEAAEKGQLTDDPEIEKAIKQARSPTAEEEVREVVQESNAILASAWIQTLLFSCSHGNPPLDLKTLDDAMLPPGAKFRINLPWPDKMDDQFAREILRQVRRDLPEGKYLPEGMKELIEFNGGKIQ